MEFIVREIETNNWITLVLIVCASLLAFAKLLNPVLFYDFIVFFNTNKYFSLDQKANKLSSLFNSFLIMVQIISISLFVYLCLNSFEWKFEYTRTLLFLKIAIVYALIVICKLLIEKIIGAIFSIDSIIDDYLFHKVSYRNFIGVILLPVNILIVYTVTPTKTILIIIIALLLILNIFFLSSVYKKQENIILGNLSYFILYLCALEIAPYFILYKLVTK